MQMRPLHLLALVVVTLLITLGMAQAQDGLPPLPLDLETGLVLFPNVTTPGTLQPGETRFYVLLANANETVEVLMTRRSGELVPYLELRTGPDAEPLVTQPASDLAGRESQLRFTAPETGWYYLLVSNDPALGDNSAGDYDLLLTGTTSSIYDLVDLGSQASTPPNPAAVGTQAAAQGGFLADFVTLTPSPLPTSTPVLTSTPTPPPPTATPEGTVLVVDRFDNNDLDWETTASNDLVSTINNGVFRINFLTASTRSGYWVVAPGFSNWSRAPIMNTPYEFTFDIANVSSDSPNPGVAILFDVTEGYATFKRFHIHQDGSWSLARWTTFQETLESGQLAAAVNWLDGGAHQVRLRVDDGGYTVNVDNVPVISTRRYDPIFGSIGFGLAEIGGAPQARTGAEFDNVTISLLDAAPPAQQSGSVPPAGALTVGFAAQVAGLDPVVSVRADATMNAQVIGELRRATVVDVIGGPAQSFGETRFNVNFTWWQVAAPDGTQGWITETMFDEPTLIPLSATEPLAATDCVLTTITGANIRSGPGTNFQQIASRSSGAPLAADSQVRVSELERWWRLLPGYWISGEAVDQSEPCNLLPVVR